MVRGPSSTFSLQRGWMIEFGPTLITEEEDSAAILMFSATKVDRGNCIISDWTLLAFDAMNSSFV